MNQGVAIQISIEGLGRLQRVLSSLGNPDIDHLLEGIGAVVESQTRRRIKDEKTGPDGKPWKDWSPKYAQTRHGKQSLLFSSGHLHDSIEYFVHGDSVEVGSNKVYARRQQLGDDRDDGKGIPARPYLGLSDQNEDEIEQAIEDFMDRVGFE